MKSLPEYAAWIDLETSGSKLDESVLLELGLIVTTLADLDTVFAKSWVIHHDNIGEITGAADPVVVDMHTRNGLWGEAQHMGWLLDVVDTQASHMVKDYCGDAHVALGGSGVSHFDRPFIRRDLPLLDKRLTYWALDVGVLRRTIQAAGLIHWIPKAGDSETKTHRALDDALQHLDEFRSYVELFNRLHDRLEA